MNRNRTLRLSLAAMMVAVAVVGSMFSFPVLGSKCSPVQHMVNVVCGILLALMVDTVASALQRSGTRIARRV